MFNHNINFFFELMAQDFTLWFMTPCINYQKLKYNEVIKLNLNHFVLFRS